MVENSVVKTFKALKAQQPKAYRVISKNSQICDNCGDPMECREVAGEPDKYPCPIRWYYCSNPQCKIKMAYQKNDLLYFPDDYERYKDNEKLWESLSRED